MRGVNHAHQVENSWGRLMDFNQANNWQGDYDNKFLTDLNNCDEFYYFFVLVDLEIKRTWGVCGENFKVLNTFNVFWKI